MLFNPSKSSPTNVKTVQPYPSSLEKDLTATTKISPSSLGSIFEKGEEDVPSAPKMKSPLHPLKRAQTSLLGLLLPPRSVTPAAETIRKALSTPSFQHTAATNCVTPELQQLAQSSDKQSQSCLVYLIRHGEASHNVLEKAAKKRAKEQAEAQGLRIEQVEERMEAARIAVLCDETLRDAKLSEQGRDDALKARRRLDEIVQLHALTPPTKVLVSPLTRTLETADLIFPDLDTIHVREEIQERQTGKPCDCRQSSTFLSSRPSFQRFEMASLRQSSFVLQREGTTNTCEDDDDDSSSSSDGEEDGRFHFEARRWMSDCRSNRPIHIPPPRTLSDPEVEDQASLRERTRKLLGLLDERSIAVVTHKGYLRELERGTLCQPEAKEFGNGEIRVYRIHLNADQSLEKAERII